MSSNGVVYFGAGADGYVIAADANTGALLWQSPTGAPVFAPPLVANGTLFVADFGGKLAAYSLP